MSGNAAGPPETQGPTNPKATARDSGFRQFSEEGAMGSGYLNSGSWLEARQYLLGHREEEELRLKRQAAELRDDSARLFDRIGPGCR